MGRIIIAVATWTFTLVCMLGVAVDVAVVRLHAQEAYPSKPIKLILPQPPGGVVDLVARSLGEALYQSMGQPVIVENQPGANGSLAAARVARSTPDGYTLFMAVDTNLVVNPQLYPNLAYDPFRDFIPISVVARVPMILVINSSVPANTVQELIALAKAKPGKLNYASIGIGTQQHLGMELFKIMTKTEITQISYRGTAPAITDLIAGVVDVMFTGAPSASALAPSGKLKMLGVASPQRSAFLPQVPTLAEAGVPGYELTGWFGLLAPAGTAQNVVDRLSQGVKKAIADAQFRARLTEQGLDIIGSSPDEMVALMKEDTRKWGEVIRAAKVTAPDR